MPGTAKYYFGTIDESDPWFYPPQDGSTPACLFLSTYYSPYDAYSIYHPGGRLIIELFGYTEDRGTLNIPILALYIDLFRPEWPCSYRWLRDSIFLSPDLDSVFPAGDYTVVVAARSRSYLGTYVLQVDYDPATATHFVDVPTANWAYDYIQALRNAGITGGCGNGNYCPQGLVARDQMAAFLVRAVEGEPAANYCGGSSSFSDVSPDVWSCRYIKRLSELNITGGCGGGNYCPQGLVTSEQMAVFIVRALEGNPAANYCSGIAPFNDVPANSWSCGYIKKLVELGVTQGCGNGNYCPGNEVNREQMAAFLARAFLDME